MDLSPAGRTEPTAPTPGAHAPLTARPVVAGVCDTATSLVAAETAGRLASNRGLPLRLVWALPVPDAGPGGVPAPHGTRGGAREFARAELDRLARSLDVPAGVTTAVRDGPPDLVLLHEARQASFLVVGGAEHPNDAESVAQILVRRSPCPVLVDRPAAARGTIVVGVTGAPGTAALLAATAAEATRRGSRLLVLHGWSGDGGPRPVAADAVQAAVDDAERALCRGYLDPLHRQFPDLAAEVRIEHGHPEDYLVRATTEAELLVVGRRVRADRSCTAATVAAAAATPVLVVPLEAAAGDRRPARPGAVPAR